MLALHLISGQVVYVESSYPELYKKSEDDLTHMRFIRVDGLHGNRISCVIDKSSIEMIDILEEEN